MADFFRALLEESPTNQEATDWWSRKYAYDERVIDDPGPIRPLPHAVLDLPRIRIESIVRDAVTTVYVPIKEVS